MAVTNLLLRSEEFDSAGWNRAAILPFGSGSIQNATASPAGTLTADRITEDTTTAQHFVNSNSTSIPSNTAITASVYIKFDGAGRSAFLQVNDSTNYAGVVLAQNGSVAAQDTGFTNRSFSAQAIENGWYRLRMSLTTATATSIVIRVLLISGTTIQNYTGDGTSGLYIWGAQLEQASTAGEYVPTTSVVNSAPRFDHSITSSTTNIRTFSDAILAANGYSVTGGGSLVAVSTATPTGSATASLLTLNIGTNTGNTSDGLNYGSGLTLTNSTQYTESLFVKPAGSAVLRLRSNVSGGVFDFTLTGDGTAPSLSSELQGASIVPFPNGWYRISWTFTTTTSAPGNRGDYWAIKTNVADGINGVYVAGAQLEQAATVGPYVPTTTAAATINNTESLGLMVEEQRTNSIRNNTMVGAVTGTPGTLPTNWGAAVQGGLTRSIVEIGTENGITYADIRINGTANAGGVVQIQFDVGGSGVGPAASGQTWTASFYSKIVAGSAANITVFNNLIFGQLGTTFIESASGSTSFTPTTTLTRYLRSGSFSNANTNCATSGLNLAFNNGAVIDITLRIGLPQLEQGASVTSVIPTTTAAATRAADVATITGAAFSPWYRQDEGTVFVKVVNNGIASQNYLMGLSSGSSYSNSHLLYTISGALGGETFVGSTQQSSVAIGSIAVGQKQSAVYGYKINDFAAARNGALGTPDTSGSLPSPDRLMIGCNFVSVAQLNGTIERLTFWPTRLPNTTLQRITQ